MAADWEAVTLILYGILSDIQMQANTRPTVGYSCVSVCVCVRMRGRGLSVELIAHMRRRAQRNESHRSMALALRGLIMHEIGFGTV